jgi:hypothetical protein
MQAINRARSVRSTSAMILASLVSLFAPLCRKRPRVLLIMPGGNTYTCV